MPTAPKPPNRSKAPAVPPVDSAALADDAQADEVQTDAVTVEPDAEPNAPADEQDAIALDVQPASEPEPANEVESDPVAPAAEQVTAPAVEPVVVETEPAAVEPAAPVAPPAPELTASQVLQRRMGLGKLIADRLAGKLTDEEQQALARAHAEQDFEEYSRLVALIQYRPKASA